MKIPFVDLGAQYQLIREEVDRAVLAVLAKGDFILGEDVRLFESEFAAFCGTRYAMGVSSGTDAIRLALEACGVGRGDEVITATNSYIATAEAISQVGAVPVLLDVSPVNYNINIAAIKGAITPRTRAIVPVHLYGQPVDMDPILAIAREHGLRVVEDACQAHGAKYKGKMAGAMGDLGCFSFYPAKNLGAYGDGGMVITNNGEYAEKIEILRNHGQKVKYHHLVKGSNSRLDTLQAAALRVKLQHLKQWNDLRRKNAKIYKGHLEKIGITSPVEEPFSEHVYHLFVVAVNERGSLQKFLSQNGIESGIHYPIPIHEQAAYKELRSRGAGCPVAEELSGKILSLPFFPEMKEEQIQYVVQKIDQFYALNSSCAR